MYSQNKEEEHIVKFFGGFKGRLLDIGANDGVTFSNSFQLILQGWDALLLEPSMIAYSKLHHTHHTNQRVKCVCAAIGTHNGEALLYESGPHLPHGNDFALLSSFNAAKIQKWRDAGVEFNEMPVTVITYDRLLEHYNYPVFDFITIDAEGMDLDILQQINLTNTRLLCIEWNSIDANKKAILEYTHKYGMGKIIYQSPENLLIAR